MNSNQKIFHDRKAWPENVRIYPPCLIQSGVFTASQSTKQYEDEKLLYTDKSLIGIVTKYTAKKTLGMPQLIVLLELIDMMKYCHLYDSYEFSTGRLLERLKQKRTGSAYSNLNRLLEDLAKLRINVRSEFTDTGKCETSETSLFNFIETSEFAYKSGQKEDIEAEEGRAVCCFQFSDLMIELLQTKYLSSVHTKILHECGKSPITIWLYIFYSTHGANANKTYEYTTYKLAVTSGLEKGYSSVKNKLKSQLAHRIKIAIAKLKSLHVFQKVLFIKTTDKTDTYYAYSMKVIMHRFAYDTEKILSNTALEDRASMFEQLLT